MSRALLSVGCDSYDHIERLAGAEQDARLIYDLLRDPAIGGYDNNLSTLLLSPRLSDFRGALETTLFARGSIDVLTIFFAGHGAMASGTFYLCLGDTQTGRFSATGFRLLELFSMIGEAQPQHTNIIIDACHAGGVAFDLNGLLKPEVLGAARTPGISLFGAAAADEYALEAEEGGVATSALISLLRGDSIVQEARPWLDLVEVSQAASEMVADHGRQTPVVWGLNLFGAARFSRNPRFRAAGDLPSLTPLVIPAGSTPGRLIEAYAEKMWEEYQRLPVEFDARRLHELLAKIAAGLSSNPTQLISFVVGVAQTMSLRATRSDDPMVKAQVLACCALVLLPHARDQAVAKAMATMLEQATVVGDETFELLFQAMQETPLLLIAQGDPFSQLFYLPLRLSRTLGWIGASVLLRRLGLRKEQDRIATLQPRVASLIDRYGGSIVAMSDSQAPDVVLFCRACEVLGWRDLRDGYLGRLWNNFLAVRGRVADGHLAAEQAFSYLLARAQDKFSEIDHRIIARPTILAGALLSCAWRASLAESVDPRLHELDHHQLNVFVPASYYDFAAERMLSGINFTFRIGHGVWTINDFAREYESVCKRTIIHGDGHERREVVAAVIMASLLYPDRVPFLVNESERFSSAANALMSASRS